GGAARAAADLDPVVALAQADLAAAAGADDVGGVDRAARGVLADAQEAVDLGRAGRALVPGGNDREPGATGTDVVDPVAQAAVRQREHAARGRRLGAVVDHRVAGAPGTV